MKVLELEITVTKIKNTMGGSTAERRGQRRETVNIKIKTIDLT